MNKQGKAVAVLLALFAFAAASLRVSPSHAQTAQSAGELNVKIAESVLITSSRGYCWFPNIYRLSDGELFVQMGLGPDTTAPESSFAAFCVSNDGGKTWGPRVSEGPLFSAGLLTRFPTGERKLMGVGFRLFAFPQGQSRNLEGMMTEISDGWNVITHRRGIRVTLPEPAQWEPVDRSNGGVLAELPAVVFCGCILKSRDGGLLVPMYGKLVGDKYDRSFLMKSMDGGLHWSYLSTIAKVDMPWPGMGNEGANEPGLARLADGRLICLLRTGSDGLMYQTWSADDGKTWETPVSTGVKGVAPQVGLLSSGVLACTYGRPGPVSIMFSLDGTGKTWTHHTPIFQEMSTRYTGFLEVAPHRLLVVYDHVPYGWKPIPPSDTSSRNEIYGTFIDVQ
jgi:hypothetical protein